MWQWHRDGVERRIMERCPLAKQHSPCLKGHTTGGKRATKSCWVNITLSDKTDAWTCECVALMRKTAAHLCKQTPFRQCCGHLASVMPSFNHTAKCGRCVITAACMSCMAAPWNKTVSCACSHPSGKGHRLNWKTKEQTKQNRIKKNETVKQGHDSWLTLGWMTKMSEKDASYSHTVC